LDSGRFSELGRLVLSCDFDLSGFDAYGEATGILTGHGAVRAGALAANCSIEACTYADFADACAVAIGERKTRAAAGASANMIEVVKTAKDLGEVVVISIASVASAAVVTCQVYEAAQNLDRSQQ